MPLTAEQTAEIKDLQKRRSSRKGKITTARNSYDRLRLYNIEELSTEDLDKMRKTIQESITNYEEIQ